MSQVSSRTERPLRWGILSTARIALGSFIPGVRAGTTGEVVAIGSRDLARAQAAGESLNIPRAYGSYEALLADPDVDAIYIGLPNGMHAEWTVKAAQAGKHVLCEKPHTRRVAEAESMVAACREASVLLMEAFRWRHHPQQARVKELVRAGAIGEPTFARASLSFLLASQGSNGLNVRLQPELDGGSLMDLGCYAVDAVRWALDAEPVAVMGQQLVDARYGVDTTFMGLLQFPGERIALVDCSFRHARGNRYETAGSDGRLEVERILLPEGAGGRIHLYRGDEHTVEDIPAMNQFAAEADHFARSIAAGQLLAPAEDGVAQARVIEALYRSAETGTAVTLA
jgi:predicted dehydrogenase